MFEKSCRRTIGWKERDLRGSQFCAVENESRRMPGRKGRRYDGTLMACNQAVRRRRHVRMQLGADCARAALLSTSGRGVTARAPSELGRNRSEPAALKSQLRSCALAQGNR